MTFTRRGFFRTAGGAVATLAAAATSGALLAKAIAPPQDNPVTFDKRGHLSITTPPDLDLDRFPLVVTGNLVTNDIDMKSENLVQWNVVPPGGSLVIHGNYSSEGLEAFKRSVLAMNTDMHRLPIVASDSEMDEKFTFISK
jgi:hypothetical protein